VKRILLAVILLGMFGWTIYEFVLSSDDVNSGKETVQGNTENDESFKTDVEKAFETATAGEVEETTEDTAAEKEIGLDVGNLAPDFQLTTLNGEETSLSDYRGSKVMLNFWATWCPPCRAEMPDMEKFYQDTDIEILAVNLTETENHVNQVQKFADEYELTFPILLDEVIEVATLYAIQPVPTSFMIDSEGVIQFKTFGPLTYGQMVQVSEDMD